MGVYTEDGPTPNVRDKSASMQEEALRNGDLDEAFEDMENRDVALLAKIIRYIVDQKVSSIITHMLNSYRD